ncbi:MAG TPA: acyltransferase [Gemmatimonadales bacterium]|nr:acyltransferase [Gemmatimonadales bacterium]
MHASSHADRPLERRGRGRWPALDGLRAVAIGLVIAGHIAHDIWIAAIGVELFFVLSGFLITRLLVDEYAQNGRIAVGVFWVRRALRIFPAFYVALFVGALLLRGSPDMPPQDTWIASATYLSDYHFALHPQPSALSHTWSLAVEEQFYLLWPLALALLLKGGHSRAMMALALLAAGITLWRVWLQEVIGASQGYLYFAFDTRADFLAAGAMLGLAWDTGWFQDRRARIAPRAWSPLLTGAGLIVVGGIADPALGHAVSFPVKVALTALFLAQLLVLGGRGVWTILDTSTMRWLGALSYSLYLYHLLAWPYAATIRGTVGRIVFWLVTALAAAAASYYAVERPMLRIRDRVFPTRSAGAGPAATAGAGFDSQAVMTRASLHA